MSSRISLIFGSEEASISIERQSYSWQRYYKSQEFKNADL